ncbi:PIN domain nuclease [Actinoplanes sp. NPDC051475]|uniref:PIN domain nuclease n=1 Tax=Actinoplanes sp. NPDC051475 TaxID=3157225 RepID=UPI00344CF915
MSRARYLVDTSAFVRIARNKDLQAVWREELASGLVAACSITELELLFSARSKAHREDLKAVLWTLCAWVVMPDQVFERASEVQAALTEAGAHRSAGPVDLLVAAAAEVHRLALIHYDADFDQIAAVTGQRMYWVADPGSID